MKKSIQKALSLLFAFSFFISGAPFVNWFSVDASAATEELWGGPNNAFEYQVASEGGEEYIRIVDIDSSKLSDVIEIPETIDDKPVEIITGFGDLKDVTEITISSTVKNMYRSSSYIFSGTDALVKYNVAPGNKKYFSIDGVLFESREGSTVATLLRFPRGKTFKDYEIPETVNVNGTTKTVYSISDNAFLGCKNLTGTLTIPKGITYSYFENKIEPSVFMGCINIEYFEVDDENEYYFDDNGVLYVRYGEDRMGLLAYPSASKMKSYSVLDNTTGWGDAVNEQNLCFVYANNLEELIIPASVKEIGANTVYSCENLERVIFEERADSRNLRIFEDAFKHCPKLSEINLPGTLTELNDGACENVTIYFDGTEEEWNTNVTVKPYNVEAYVIIFKDSVIKPNGDVSLIYNGNEYENVELIVNEISSSNYETAFENNSFEIWKKDYEIIVSRQIKVKVDGVEVKEFDSPITLVFDIPEEYHNISSNRFAIYHLSSVDGYEIFDTTGNYKNLVVKNGKVYIIVNSLSPFALGVSNSSSSGITNKTISSVSIKTYPERVNYKGDLSDLALTVTYTDGTTETVTDTSKMKITGFDSTKIGTQTVTVEYEGRTNNFEVTVSYAWWQMIIRILLLGFLWY